jgi:UrcA family protein
MDTTSSPNSSSRFVTRILSAALAIGATAWAIGATTGMASAQTAASTAPAQAVSYADLDVNTREGAATLLKRINLAAHSACGGEPVRSPLLPRNAAVFRECVNDAVDAAVTKFNAPMLASLHQGGFTGDATTLASR